MWLSKRKSETDGPLDLIEKPKDIYNFKVGFLETIEPVRHANTLKPDSSFLVI